MFYKKDVVMYILLSLLLTAVDLCSILSFASWMYAAWIKECFDSFFQIMTSYKVHFIWISVAVICLSGGKEEGAVGGEGGERDSDPHSDAEFLINVF